MALPVKILSELEAFPSSSAIRANPLLSRFSHCSMTVCSVEEVWVAGPMHEENKQTSEKTKIGIIKFFISLS